MSNGTQIYPDMTESATLPTGSWVPFVDQTNSSRNQRFDLGAELLNFVSYTALALAGGSALVGFEQAGTGAVLSTVQDELRAIGIRPEQFGAVGNGLADDSAAIQKAYTQAQATGLPLIFSGSATYGIGSTNWVGLNWTLSRGLVIQGNGATLKILAAATQSAVAGAVNPAIKIDGTASYFGLTIRHLEVDFNGIKEPVFAPDRCTLDVAAGCRPYGGAIDTGIGDASIFIYANRCTGRVCDNGPFEYCPFFFYGGHTDAGMECFDLTITGNIGSKFYGEGNPSVRGDPYNGVVDGATIDDNTFEDYYGLGFSGVAANGTVCRNVTVTNNRLTGFTASGIQTDNVGTISSTGFVIKNNTLNDAVGSAAPIYMLQLESSSITGNQGVNCATAMLFDNCPNGNNLVSGNHFKRGTGGAGQGINMLCQVGNTANFDIKGNRLEGFTQGIYASGGGGTLSNVNIRDNTITGGNEPLRIDDTVTALFVDGNTFAGGSTFDINNTSTNGQVGVQFGQNKFASANGVAQLLPIAQPTPTAKTGDATLTIAELLTGIVTATKATAVALTLPTGTLTDAGVGTMAIGQSFEWAVINLGSASGAVTMTNGTDHTYVGNATVAISTSARLRTAKTAANTFITYRVS